MCIYIKIALEVSNRVLLESSEEDILVEFFVIENTCISLDGLELICYYPSPIFIFQEHFEKVQGRIEELTRQSKV